MFRETLLESAPGARRRKRWPMILAVALEVTVCSLLVALPPFSTGIIPVSARTTTDIDFPRIEPRPVVDSRPVGHDGGQGPVMPRPSVIPIADGKPHITFGPPVSPGDEVPVPTNFRVGPSGPGLPTCVACDSGTRVRGPETGPHHVSSGVSEGYLFHRVEPIYPRMALLTGVRGEVRLHAIISKDGVIERLTLISGHPMLAKAAMDAVQQWRYHPYLLNNEPVEVETLITVNFNPGH